MNANPIDAKWKIFSDKIELQNDTVYVFRIFAQKYYPVAVELKDILSADEAYKASRYFHINDRKNYVSAKTATRMILSKLLCKDPEKIQFLLSPNKKPYVEGIEYNVSHSGDQILIAVCKKPVGIDIEYINRSFNIESLVASVFNSDETSDLNLSKDLSLAFYHLWTKKEALLKATGEGLVDDLTQISVLHDSIKRGNTLFLIKSFLSTPEYIWSLAFSSEISKIVYLDYQ
ncbi:4'-phosphopantetheinyl transferase superfamily protein [Pedobacter sp. V48]|uniref:4'-phosphopantetheinyl transferase family protein n=1 Tax=Pedobacter sp. V48 TaxID=509635 RepID=UPI0003E516D9|nr:4'-phosphopantetheinyl transferase superfamily protein [Pedobacter sp. V48]ETZ22623.1 hypothetical protein N824_22375 [Pedobacter sp. V48]